MQPQIIKTDSLVLTPLKTDRSPVIAAMQNPTITTLTAPMQTTALQVPVGIFIECTSSLTHIGPEINNICCPWMQILGQ